jgi:hypothetical protein
MELKNFRHSEKVGQILAALSRARKKFKELKKEALNPFYKSKYSDLNAVVDACIDALSDEEIAVIQAPVKDREAKEAGVITFLGHSSDEWFEGELLLPTKDWTAQACGSSITFARRYSLEAFVALAGELDDDANLASGKEVEARAAAIGPPPPEVKHRGRPKKSTQQLEEFVSDPKPVTWRQRFWSAAKARNKSDTQIREFLGSLGYEHTGDVPPQKYDECMAWAEDRPPDLPEMMP